MSGKHAPNKFGSYIAIHNKVIADFREKGLVEDETLELRVAGNSFLLLTGKIHCIGGIVIDVDKTIEVLAGRSAERVLLGRADDALVQNVEYSYNVRVELPGRTVSLFRYDNAHDPDGHHRHAFSWPEGRKVGAPAPVSAEDYPTLGEVVIEATEWYWEHLSELTRG